MQTLPRRLTPADAAAVYAYLTAGGPVHVYATGARALPPTFDVHDPRPPRVVCVHTPVFERLDATA